MSKTCDRSNLVWDLTYDYMYVRSITFYIYVQIYKDYLTSKEFNLLFCIRYIILKHT